MEPVNMVMRIPVNTAERMPYPNEVREWLDESRKSLENYVKSQEEAELRRRQEATAERTKCAPPKPALPQPQLKPQPESLCSCPLRCDKKISQEQKKTIYEHFRDKFKHSQQNTFLQRHLKIKSLCLGEKTQRRVTCKYFIPTIGSAKETNRHARTLNYDTITRFLDTSFAPRNGFKLNHLEDRRELETANVDTNNRPRYNSDSPMDLSTTEPTTCAASPMDLSTTEPTTCAAFTSLPRVNGFSDSPPRDQQQQLHEQQQPQQQQPQQQQPQQQQQQQQPQQQQLDSQPKEAHNGETADSPPSSNDDDASSVKSAEEEEEAGLSDYSDEDCIDYSTRVRYVEVCQKAFMNMYGVTEKRIRWQREKLTEKMEARLHVLAEERQKEAKERRKEAEETNRVLSVARSLGAGCQPLLDLLKRANCDHMFPQLIVAIGDDVELVDNFFQNQLWKPEDIMDMSVGLANLDSIEMESD